MENHWVHALAWMKNGKGQIRVVSTEKDETVIVWRVNFDKKSLRIHSRCLDVISESTHKVLKCIATHPQVPGWSRFNLPIGGDENNFLMFLQISSQLREKVEQFLFIIKTGPFHLKKSRSLITQTVY
jgi:hypothetical protein